MNINLLLSIQAILLWRYNKQWNNDCTSYILLSDNKIKQWVPIAIQGYTGLAVYTFMSCPRDVILHASAYLFWGNPCHPHLCNQQQAGETARNQFVTWEKRNHTAAPYHPKQYQLSIKKIIISNLKELLNININTFNCYNFISFVYTDR